MCDIKYLIKRQDDKSSDSDQAFCEGDLVVATNSYALKIRTDKIVSEILKRTRAEVKRLEKAGIIIVTEARQEHKIMIEIRGKWI
jgi:hypothetical protein